jgi:transposase
VLLASDGLATGAIATAVSKSVLTVRRWRRRFTAKGVDGLLKDATRPSRVQPLTPDKIKHEILKVSTRCGFSSCACHIRWTLL